MNIREELKKIFDEQIELEKIHFDNAKNLSYGYLIGFRHDNASLRETKKQEAFFHAGMAEAYKRVSISIDKMLQNHEKIDQS